MGTEYSAWLDNAIHHHLREKGALPALTLQSKMAYHE